MRFDDVWLRYHRTGPWVLRSVSVQLAPADVVVVTGRNGTGKSTLLQLAAGVLRPVRGRITGRPGRIGWVPERFPADQPFTVRQYLTMMAAARGDAAGDLDRWGDRLHLRPYFDVRLPELSKGTAQKVGLVQALLSRPELLILDEPWEGLDTPTRLEVPGIIAEVAGAGGIVLVSDHLGETARLPGAQHWRLLDGELAVDRPVDEVEYVVRVVVQAREVPAAVARLRSDGHEILDVQVRGEHA